MRRNTRSPSNILYFQTTPSSMPYLNFHSQLGFPVMNCIFWSWVFSVIISLHAVTLYISVHNHDDLFQQKMLILFLEFFIGQRSLNLTVEKIEQVHAYGIAFMQAAKELFPYRNGYRNKDGSHIGWNVWKFHSILHKAMDLLLYGWSENMSTQSGESAHKVNCFVLITHCYTLLHTVTQYFTLRFDISVLLHFFSDEH